MTQGIAPRIAAVVVTRNRVDLLERCIACLQRQTRRLDAIIVVDCQSSDGTREYLKTLPAPIIPILLDKNAGSGGGQYAGTRYAYDHGYDWAWCMDDDGYAAPDALEKIVAVMAESNADWLNSLVLDVADPTRTSFVLTSKNVHSRKAGEIQKAGAVIDGASPFNGTLLSRRLFDVMGFPAPELFIWGDEVEFLLRAYRYNLKVCTVTQSLYYHPSSDSVPPVAVRHTAFWKYYYQVRNTGSAGGKDGTLTLSGKQATRRGFQLLFQLWRGAFRIFYYNFGKSWIVIKAMIAAWRQDLTQRYPR